MAEYKDSQTGHYEPIKGENGAMNTRTAASDIIQPVDLQTRYHKTVQTHNAVSVGANSFSDGSWIDVDGFDNVALSLANDGSTSSSFLIFWSSDGINNQGGEYDLELNTRQQKSVEITTKAKYMKVRVMNNDAAAHTMSAWAYLKA